MPNERQLHSHIDHWRDRAMAAEADLATAEEIMLRVTVDRDRLADTLREIADYRGEPSESHAWDSKMRSLARAALDRHTKDTGRDDPQDVGGGSR